MASTIPVTQRVLARCRELGFAAAGVCDARPTEYEAQLRAWLAAGRHGEMSYLQKNVEVMIDPSRLMPGARSIVCVGDRYEGEKSKSPNVKKSKEEAAAAGGNPRKHGRVAAYARGDDYHVVMRRRLKQVARELERDYPGEVFRVCVDTAPLLEREHAARAGLGAVGKHTLLIHPDHGSWLLLGEIVTTLALPPAEENGPGPFFVDPCGACTRCIDACPTGAIQPWSVDATKCISYLTIEHRSDVNERFHEAMSDWVFGCDVCQEVCPHNQPTQRKRPATPHEAYEPRAAGFDLLTLLNWSDDDRRAAFVKSALKRAKLAMMKRNALIAAGNALRSGGDESLRQRIVEIAGDEREDAMVRAAARAVLNHPGG